MEDKIEEYKEVINSIAGAVILLFLISIIVMIVSKIDASNVDCSPTCGPKKWKYEYGTGCICDELEVGPQRATN